MADDPQAIRKRSVSIAGHRTSLSLEPAFWDALRALAQERGRSINAIIEEIDQAASQSGARDINLSSAVRVHLLRHAQQTRPSSPRER
ncbi:MAG: ribbon-helix-helix domain-containing protein [Dongiaceae bacterium]